MPTHVPDTKGLTVEERVDFLEKTVIDVITKYDRYIDYVERAIEEERAKRDFWVDVKKRLATATIIGAAGIVLTAVWFYLKNELGS